MQCRCTGCCPAAVAGPAVAAGLCNRCNGLPSSPVENSPEAPGKEYRPDLSRPQSRRGLHQNRCWAASHPAGTCQAAWGVGPGAESPVDAGSGPRSAPDRTQCRTVSKRSGPRSARQPPTPEAANCTTCLPPDALQQRAHIFGICAAAGQSLSFGKLCPGMSNRPNCRLLAAHPAANLTVELALACLTWRACVD